MGRVTFGTAFLPYLMCLLPLAFQGTGLFAQRIPQDSASVAVGTVTRVTLHPSGVQGEKAVRTGKIAIAVGGAGLLAGGALLLAANAIAPGEPPQDAIGASLAFVGGVSFATTGATVLMAAIPIYLGGSTLRNAPSPWRDINYEGNGQKGWNVMCEVDTGLPLSLGAKVGFGYHRVAYDYWGIGTGACISSPSESGRRLFSLPIYLENRRTFSRKAVAPYFGLRGGIDLSTFSNIYPYVNPEVGVRMRQSTSVPNSWWVGLGFESAPNYAWRVYYKVGYGF